MSGFHTNYYDFKVLVINIIYLFIKISKSILIELPLFNGVPIDNGICLKESSHMRNIK